MTNHASSLICGLALACVVAGLALLPVDWMIALLMLIVIAMPAILVVEPPLKKLWRERKISLSPQAG